MMLAGSSSRAGEMLVGPAKALFMDEISTGLDSSTTFQIVNSLKHFVHILQGTTVISLLQPAPETYDLFDDIILLTDGIVVYQGPRENVLEFFESMGFQCPARKGVADFLQEVTSKKDKMQYWTRRNEPYRFVTSREFSEAFQSSHVGRRLGDELAVPFDKILVLFFSVGDGGVYVGALFFGVVMIMFNGMSELAMTIVKLPVLPVFFKQRDLLFYPSWAYALPSWIIKIPISFLEVTVWVILTYYVIGFDPNAGRTLYHVIREKKEENLYCFCDPARTRSFEGENFSKYMLDRMRNVDPDSTLIFVPHNPDKHWILSIIYNGKIFLLNSMSGRYHKWETALINVVKQFSAERGKPTKNLEVTCLKFLYLWNLENQCWSLFIRKLRGQHTVRHTLLEVI